MYIIYIYLIKKNVLNYKCVGFFMVIMFKIFLEILYLIFFKKEKN